MSSQTFGDCWRKVRLHAPQAPFGLVREWTLNAYKELCERRPWVFTTIEYQLQTLAARSLAVTFVSQSKAITSAGLFVASDAGRQIRVGTFPVYSIDQVLDASTATLDLIFTGDSGAQTAQILSAYQTMPPDFGAFQLIADLTNQRLVPWWYTQEDLTRLDPTRTSSDVSPRCLVPRKLSSCQATLGQMQYEWWPYPTSARAFPAYYRARPQDLADTDVFQGVLAERSGILQTGALMYCARWPGTESHKNPYFSMATYKELRDDFENDCAKLELRDDDQSLQSWVALPYHSWRPWDLGGYSTQDLRASDATVFDYR